MGSICKECGGYLWDFPLGNCTTVHNMGPTEKPESKPQEDSLESFSRPWPFHHFPEDLSTWECVQRKYDALKKGLTEIEAILEKAKEALNIALMSASVEAKECDKLRKENEKLRGALEKAMGATEILRACKNNNLILTPNHMKELKQIYDEARAALGEKE